MPGAMAIGAALAVWQDGRRRTPTRQASVDASRLEPRSEQPGLQPHHPLLEDPAVAALLAAWPHERVQEELDRLLELWGIPDLRAVIRWRWNPRLQTTVGRALMEDMVLELNPRLLARHPEEVRPVLAHEAGHLAVQRYFGRQPAHGRIWKALMRRAAVSTRATHRLDVRDLRRRRVRR